MAGASSDWIFIAVLGGGTVVLAFLYVFYRLRLRKADVALRRDTNQTEEERAYNQIRITRAGADHLHQEGFDVAPVRALLGEAETAQKRRDHASALSLSDRAKQRLYEIRRAEGAPRPTVELPRLPAANATGPVFGAAGSAAMMMPTGSAEDPEAEAEAETSPRGKLPPHQVEARFELTELERDLANAAGAGDATARSEAAETGRSARAAYDRADYTEAWRLALRARRRLGGSVESIGESRAVAPASKATTAPVPSASPAAAPPCPGCGHATRTGDLFCRYCGRPVGAGTCARCGAKNENDDRFCAVCGSPIGT